ncbi:hypothetical protein D9757_013275 [Collybiopsis confluens]|uniref:Dienelactone hydrolase domain-containing protein n=1 Tax=Collybiopsis confluens TaxID=2823264 RepID=A0A8H5FWA4_9AGAR|nr:hypothetical protein D9757_013275 [Collybiopsis confluens]
MSATNRVLAGPPGDCCFKGFQHHGTAEGSKISIAGVPTYFVEPKNKNQDKILIFLADVWGPFYQSNALLQDFFAQSEEGFDRMKWIGEMHKIAKGVVPKWWEAVKEKYGTDAKYIVSGYCFGAAYTMDLAADNAIVAASIAHPAFLNEDHFRKITKPLMLSCAETDHTFPLPSRRIAEDILIEHKRQYYFQVFSGVAHGFASRGDPNISDERWGREQSAQGISGWFHRFLDEKHTSLKQKL